MDESSVYTNGKYLDRNETWHAEDSPWKAEEIYKMMVKNGLQPGVIDEVGCGAGVILKELSRKPSLLNSTFRGLDISPQAIEMAQVDQEENIEFVCGDITREKDRHVDMLLAIDVFEHVPDYWGFLSACRTAAKYKMYHIPLDINVSSVLRDTSDKFRAKLGHIHLFSAASALSTLRDTGHEILDVKYTSGAISLFRYHPSLKRGVSNIPRGLLGMLSVPWAARIFGGYSLLVLTT